MPIKNSIIIVSIIAVYGTAFAWVKSASQTNGRDIQTAFAGSNVPLPGPGQKKVVLKTLGMA